MEPVALGEIFDGKMQFGPWLTLTDCTHDVDRMPDEKVRDELKSCFEDLAKASETVDDKYLHFHERLAKRTKIAELHEDEKHATLKLLGAETDALSRAREISCFIDLMEDPQMKANAIASYVHIEFFADALISKTTTLEGLLASDLQRDCLKFFKDMVKKFEANSGQNRTEIENEVAQKRIQLRQELSGQDNALVLHCKALLDDIAGFMDSFRKEPGSNASPRVTSPTPKALKHQFRHGKIGSKWWYKSNENGVNRLQTLFNGLDALNSRLQKRMEEILKGDCTISEKIQKEHESFLQEQQSLTQSILEPQNFSLSKGGHTVLYYTSKAKAFAFEVSKSCKRYGDLVKADGKYRPVMMLVRAVMLSIRLGSEVPTNDSVQLLKRSSALATHVARDSSDKLLMRIWNCLSKNLARQLRTPLKGEGQIATKLLARDNLDELEVSMREQYLVRQALLRKFFPNEQHDIHYDRLSGAPHFLTATLE